MWLSASRAYTGTTQANKLGININGAGAYYAGPMWLNCLRQAGSNTIYCSWFTGNSTVFDTGEEAYVQMDANGNPISLTAGNGFSGTQQFTKLFTYIYTNIGTPPNGATYNYLTGQYTVGFKIGGTGSATTLQFQLSGDVSSLASQTSGVTVSGTTVTSTLAPGSAFTLTFTASGGISGFIITIPAGAGISPSCYLDFASGHIVPTAYLANYNAGQILHPNFKAEFEGCWNGPMRWMSMQRTNNQEWQATFTGTLLQNATGGTISALSQQGKFGQLAISGATWTSGVATITAANPISYANGSQFTTTVSGVNPSGYNGTYLCTATGAKTFTYSLSTNPGTYVNGGAYAAWTWATGTKNFIFSTGQVISVSGTYGQTAVSWSTPLSGTVSTSSIGAMAVASEQKGWSNRPKLTNLSWNGPQGPPLEALIQASNELGRDCYLCVPASAQLVDSTYNSNLATLVKTGSNAVLGDNITSFSGLWTSQKCYVEFSNETWNAGSSYKQAVLCYMMSVPSGFYAGQGNSQYYGGEEWKGYMTGNVAAAFSSAFGSQFASRVVVMVMSQFAGAQGANFIKVAMNTPDDTAHAYTKGISAYGFAPYWGTDALSVADATHMIGLADPVGEMYSILYKNVGASGYTYSINSAGLIGMVLNNAAAEIADLQGQPWSNYPIIGYEGGSGIDDAPNIETSVSGWRVNVLNAFQLDPRFEYTWYDPTSQLSANLGYLPGLKTAGFSFICQLSDVSAMLTHTSPPGGANWGALQSVMQLPQAPTSKYTGMKNWINA